MLQTSTVVISRNGAYNASMVTCNFRLTTNYVDDLWSTLLWIIDTIWARICPHFDTLTLPDMSVQSQYWQRVGGFLNFLWFHSLNWNQLASQTNTWWLVAVCGAHIVITVLNGRPRHLHFSFYWIITHTHKHTCRPQPNMPTFNTGVSGLSSNTSIQSIFPVNHAENSCICSCPLKHATLHCLCLLACLFMSHVSLQLRAVRAVWVGIGYWILHTRLFTQGISAYRYECRFW